MKTNPYRGHSIAAAVAAALVTTVLVGSVVESLNPAALKGVAARSSAGSTVAQARRAADSTPAWT
jgi:hypothetical protein